MCGETTVNGFVKAIQMQLYWINSCIYNCTMLQSVTVLYPTDVDDD